MDEQRIWNHVEWRRAGTYRIAPSDFATGERNLDRDNEYELTQVGFVAGLTFGRTEG